MTMSILERLLEAAAKNASRPFLKDGGASLDYANAWRGILGVAGALADARLDSPLVGVLAERGAFAYQSILATIAAGRAYVPLNARLPGERLRRIIDLSGMEALFVGSGLGRRMSAVLQGIERLRLVLTDDESPQVPPSCAVIRTGALHGADAEPRPPRSNDDPLYLLFTSGSTGVPKGVPVSHDNVLAYLDAVTKRYGYGPEDVHSQTFELSFDLSVHDLLCAWTTGGAVAPFRGSALLAPHRVLSEAGLTCWFSVPSLGLLMEKARTLKDGAFPDLRVSLFCGEPLPARLAEAWLRAAPNSIVDNLYGPTEATIAITHFRCERAAAERSHPRGIVPIGRPFDGQQVELVEPGSGSRLAPGPGSGELLLSGTQLARGYLNDPELTRERFPADLFGDGRTWYRTGDLVERDGDGCLHFVGRLDTQIKLNGYRIELAEIEGAARRVSGTDLVVAMPWPRDSLQVRGITLIVAGSDRTVEDIRSGLKNSLPIFMLPSIVEIWEELPLNVNGKIDRRQIEECLAAGASSRGTTNADQRHESRERELFREILRRPERFIVIQGLPKYYFREYAEIFGRTPGAAGRADVPVFISPSAAPVSQIAALGAECYALRSIPGLDRECEIRAYERAHAALAAAHSRMSTAETDLVQLCVDSDLPILALAFFLPEAEAFLAARFGERKIILPMRNTDDSYRVLGSKADCAFFQVRGEFADLRKPGRADRGGAPVGGEHEPQRGHAEALLGRIDESAEAHKGSDTSIVSLAAAAGDAAVIANCNYSSEHFSFECVLGISVALRDRGLFPAINVKNDSSAQYAEARGFKAFVLNKHATRPAGSGIPDAELPRFGEWPYSDWSLLGGWQRRLRAQLGHYELASKAVRALRPRSVLTYPYGSNAGRALRLAARRCGVPSFTPILLGVAGHARGFPVMDWFTKFLAYGDEARDLMTAFGVAPEQIIVTGNPRYDSIVDHLRRRDEYRRTILDGRVSATRIGLVATTGLMELDRLWLDDACRSAQQLGMRLLIKPHPSIGLAPYQPWVSGDPLVSGWEGSLEEATSACDVLLTDYSSTGFEAILYGRPLIVVNFSAHEFSYRWENEGVGVRVSNAAELHERLLEVVENRFPPEVLATQKRVVSRFNHLNDGMACARIADLLAGAGPADDRS